jgi:hypothetical protein
VKVMNNMKNQHNIIHEGKSIEKFFFWPTRIIGGIRADYKLLVILYILIEHLNDSYNFTDYWVIIAGV